jgi:membrane fusion protein, multidrug efflux system
MRILFLALVIGAAILVDSCGGNKGVSDSSSAAVRNATSPDNSSAPAPASGSIPHAAPPASFNYATAGRENLPQVSGPIIVEHQIEVMSQRDGIVAKIFVDTGARVKAGALLAELDNRQITANLEAARAKSRSIDADLKNWKAEGEVVKADYVRAQRLWGLGLTSEEQLQHAKYKAESEGWDIQRIMESLNTARQEERSLEIELEKTKIIAPFQALVARRYLHEGQNVTKGDRMFWITAEGPLLMRFTVPEIFFGRVKLGQLMEVNSADVPGESHTARVKQVSPVIDPSSGTFEVLVELTGDPGTLRPGMNANIRLENLR